ncbi:hypothetical protein [Xanthovirga aplysinae]|uniref:hypothetical protein n=1 Tax=Xanthovirga aplysinae TaxID=2529853 RepID=UPI0012BBAC68|nr:hypothetical protein [Xanthovirga aplysinae]MTI31222.1 hypothetical protein [Xanthovirga aplysinae]
MKNIFTAFSLLLIHISCTYNPNTEAPTSNKSGWQLVFRNDKNGEAKFGNKKDLIKAVRNGYPIRIGWGARLKSDTTKSVEHVIDADFLTVVNGTEVFAQIHPIIGQRPDLNKLTIKYRNSNKWSTMVGTNGYSDRLDVNYLNDSISSHENIYWGSSWYVNYPSITSEATKKAFPLWD